MSVAHIPLVFENVEANGSSDRADVGMPYLGHKLHLVNTHSNHTFTRSAYSSLNYNTLTTQQCINKGLLCLCEATARSEACGLGTAFKVCLCNPRIVAQSYTYIRT